MVDKTYLTNLSYIYRHTYTSKMKYEKWKYIFFCYSWLYCVCVRMYACFGICITSVLDEKTSIIGAWHKIPPYHLHFRCIVCHHVVRSSDLYRSFFFAFSVLLLQMEIYSCAICRRKWKKCVCVWTRKTSMKCKSEWIKDDYFFVFGFEYVSPYLVLSLSCLSKANELNKGLCLLRLSFC